jgi:hypothetical protein
MIDFVSRRFLITSDTTMCTNGLSNTCRKPMLLLKHACTIRVRQLAEPERSRRARGRQQRHEYQDPPQSPTPHPVGAASADALSSAGRSEREASQGSLSSDSVRIFALDLAIARDLGVRAAAGVLERGGSGSDAGGRQGKRRWRRTSASRNGGGRRRGGRS